MKSLVLILCSMVAVSAFAEDAKFLGESEASAVVVSGNSSNETYAAKTKNTYNITDMDSATVFGKYLRSVTSGSESNKAWEAGLRYERVFLKDTLSGFVQHKAEHDPYNGQFIQRDSTDIGAKYTFIKNADLNWFGEFGYRSSNTYLDMDIARETVGFLRIYTEGTAKLTDSASAKLWIEHLPNLKHSDESQSNAELSVSVAMNNIFSLKSAYLVNRNDAVQSPLKKDTTTWTTALVAKY